MARRRKSWNPEASTHAERWPNAGSSVIQALLTGWGWVPAVLITGVLVLSMGHFVWGWFDGVTGWLAGPDAMAPGWPEP